MGQFTNHRQIKSGVNRAPFINARPQQIQNRVYRQCAKDGFNARLRAELAASQQGIPVTHTVPLYSGSSTRQSYFIQGWKAVTSMHILRAKARVNTQNQPPSPEERH